MLPESPFETAARKAGERVTCPVWQLEDFYTDDSDLETLCSGFGCGECVAEPEDLGPTEPWTPGADPSSDDMPF